jgi:uncharacterized phage protein (TIGR02220 family)
MGGAFMDMYLLFNSFEAFCDEYEDFPQLAMIVYYKLVNRFNRRGWPELLACSNQRMMLACRIKDEETYIKHRNLLKQYGFIDFTSGKKGSPTKYKLVINTRFNRGIMPSDVPSISPSELPSETPVTKRKTIRLKKKDNNPFIPFDKIIAALNEAAGTNYRISDKHKSHIRARWDEGYTFDDFITVINKKAREWLGTDQAKYLRPETLFGTKFDTYLNQPEVGRNKREQNELNMERAAIAYDSRQGERVSQAMSCKLPAAFRY